MGYRHYIGYIEKEKYEKIVEEANKIEDDYDKTNFMQEHATEVLELGKLYYSNTEETYNALYAHKTADFSNGDTEFFVVDDDKLLLHVSYAMQKQWISFIKKCHEVVLKVSKGEKLSEEEQTKLIELEDLLGREVSYFDNAMNTHESWEFPAYNNWQFNYESCRVYNIHKNFDYSDKVMVVYAY